MDPVEHITVLSATHRELGASKDYLALERETDLARYNAIDRLSELTGPYDDGTMTLSDVLPRMPPAERTEAEQILAHIRPAAAGDPLTSEQRQAERDRRKPCA